MVFELSYTSISLVSESWEDLRRMPNYEQVAGAILFKRLFKNCPQAKVLFGFPLDADAECPEISNSKRFIMHSSYLIQMLDTALNMLGPDVELLTEIMLELGIKHIKYGVKPEMFPAMGECLMGTLNECLKGGLSDSHTEAWRDVYGSLSGDMIRAMKQGKRDSIK